MHFFIFAVSFFVSLLDARGSGPCHLLGCKLLDKRLLEKLSGYFSLTVEISLNYNSQLTEGKTLS